MIKRIFASFLLTIFMTNTVYAEKILFDSYGRPIKTQREAQANITPVTFTVETSDKTLNNQVTQTQVEKNIPVQSELEKTVLQEPVDTVLNEYLEKNKQYLYDVMKSLDKLKINSLLSS